VSIIRIASETDFQGWRQAARALRMRGVTPEETLWTVDGSRGPIVETVATSVESAPAFTVPRDFLELANAVILHRSDERFSLLYRLLWRLGPEPGLLRSAADQDVRKARCFAEAVALAVRQMTNSAHFRPMTGPLPEGRQTYVAWFEPAHRVTEALAPFYSRRFADANFAIFTPDACVLWDMKTLAALPGVDPADAPRGDGLEDYWRAYCAQHLEAPPSEGCWRNLPQARLIPRVTPFGEERTSALVGRSSSIPSERAVRAARRVIRDAPYDGQAPTSLEQVGVGVQMCRRCELFRDATQGVAGMGPARAKLMLVGEQPGDQEDLAGRPFVGPAGQMLDRALAEAGVARDLVFVTNAVKHFKHELRGKRRIHKTPSVGEVTACRWWLENERRLVRPRVIVAMGATAALSVFGKPLAIGKLRQQVLQLSDQAQGVATYHPSYLLRLPDADEKAKAYALFVEDLKFAWSLAA
jgi:DNA polymerase